MFKFTDAVSVSGTRETADGYLIAQAKCVRTGIQDYLGAEVGKPDMEVVRVYRPPEEVFADESLQSFSHAPMTMDHPTEQVNADNWKKLAVGEVSTAAKRDGDWVMLPLILKDRAAIEDMKAGKRELSAGYMCQLDWTPGTTPEGEAYDAIQRNIKINHLAVVKRARAGSEARIGDGADRWGSRPVVEDHKGESVMTDKTTHITRDGLSVTLTTDAANIVSKLFADADKALADTQAELEKARADVKAKDAELGKKDAEIEDLKTKTVDNANIDQLVADRAAVVGKAKALAPDLATDGLANAEIKRKAVAAKLGDAKVADKSDDYVDGLFDHLTSEVKPVNPLSGAIADSSPQNPSEPQSQRDAAHANYVASLTGGTNEKDA